MNSATILGLDLGTSRIVLAEPAGADYRFRSQLNAFFALPSSKLTAAVLREKGIPHSVSNGEIVVYGRDAETFADLHHSEIRRPMRSGLLNPDEPRGLELIREILTGLLADSGRQGTVYFSVPAAPLEGHGDGSYHESAVGQVLSELGYLAHPLPEALAVVYSELADTQYTGIGVSCGGGLCNVCLAYLSVPVIGFSIPRAGDYIDRSAATATGEVATRIRLLKEQSFHFNGASGDKVQQALSTYYHATIKTLIAAMEQAFANCRSLPKLHSPVPLVLSGGSVLPHGFREKFETALRSSRFPVPVSEVRLASDPLTATAKGALISALAEG